MSTVFEPHLLTNFVLVAEMRSMTAAAQFLGVTQPSISEQILKLETQLGCPLLIRNARYVELTVAGHELLPRARGLMEALDEARRVMDRLAGYSTETLRLGAVRLSGDVPERMELVQRFINEVPAFTLEITEQADDFAMLLREGHIDAHIGLCEAFEDHAGFDKMILHRSIAHVLVPKGHRLAQATELTLEDLSQQSFAVFRREDEPALFDRVYAPLTSVGCTLVQAPESYRRTIEDFASSRRLLTLKWRKSVSSRRVLSDFVGIPIAGSPITSALALFRRSGDHREKIVKLWALAESL